MIKASLIILFISSNIVAFTAPQETNNNSYDVDSVIIKEIEVLATKAFDYFETGQYDSAEFYYKKVLQYEEASYGFDHEYTATTNANLGAVYRNMNNYKKALKHLSVAERYFVKNDRNSEYLIYIFNTKANIYFDYSDYKEAELYYRHCLNLLENHQSHNQPRYGQVYVNIGNILVEQNRNEEAIRFLSELEIQNQPDLEFNRYMYLAEAYQKIGEYDLALEQTNLAKQIYDENLTGRYKRLIIYNYRTAMIYTKLGDYSKALNHLLQNIHESEKKNTTHFEKLYQTYLLIGNIHYLKQDYISCIEWLTKVIDYLDANISSTEASQNILNEQSFNRTVIDFYRLLGNAWFQLYFKNNNVDDLKKSLNNFSKSIDYLMVFRLHMRNEESIYIESGSSISLIHEAIEVAARLYKLTKDKKYLSTAFLYAENMKAFSLYSEIKSGEAIQFSDLPQNLKFLEDSLKNELNHLSELIYKERSEDDPNAEILEKYSISYVRIKNRYNSLLDSLENNFPNYFKLKYSQDFITPSQIQNHLNHNECLVEYVLSDSVLTTFVIDKKNIQVLNQPIDSNFPELCFNYFSLLQNQNFSSKVQQTYENYTALAKYFYDILVAPVLEVTKSREITFVPDGEIMYLPFESFITHTDVDKTRPNYRHLPYLIYDVSVAYSYSSTLLFSERIRSKSPSNKVLAFAPEYKNLLDEDLQSIWNRQSERDFLMPLPGAKKEVKNIAKTVSTDVYLDSAASESKFKQLASDYSVLHLAMHTIMDDENPMYSKLAFTRNFSDTTEDHDLFTYEIYNLPLNADMVVLSSCSSGYGKMQKGEGMMSMARGFIYAGCPSIVMTLWQVSDLSSAQLMSSFYKHLKKGQSKKKALRQAKIDYIQSSDNLKSNPYFWSAFLMVGDSTPLYKTSSAVYLILFISIFSLVIVGIIYRKPFRNMLRRK